MAYVQTFGSGFLGSWRAFGVGRTTTVHGRMRRGLIAEHGSSWMLPRLIGPMNALDLLYSARMVDAAEAERLGLVRKLPAENFLADSFPFV
jgi:enoyl-CoA hydratase/carnithine racemase